MVDAFWPAYCPGRTSRADETRATSVAFCQPRYLSGCRLAVDRVARCHQRRGIEMGKKSAKHMLGGTSSLLALSIALPQAIQAQSADTSNPENLDEIVVTGLIGSLQRNLDLKREATGVVDVITSEDIGKFP